MKLVITSLAALHLLAGSGLAQSFDVDIVGYGQAENFFEALSADLMVNQSGSTLDSFDGLEDTPLEGMTARCFGTTTFLKGVASGNGNCVFTDPAGHKVLQAWAVDTVTEGSAFGTWHFVGGTGSHEGIAGRGLFAQVSNSLTGAREMSITGVAVWPE